MAVSTVDHRPGSWLDKDIPCLSLAGALWCAHCTHVAYIGRKKTYMYRETEIVSAFLSQHTQWDGAPQLIYGQLVSTSTLDFDQPVSMSWLPDLLIDWVLRGVGTEVPSLSKETVYVTLRLCCWGLVVTGLVIPCRGALLYGTEIIHVFRFSMPDSDWFYPHPSGLLHWHRGPLYDRHSSHWVTPGAMWVNNSESLWYD